jgi:hypothetical protein
MTRDRRVDERDDGPRPISSFAIDYPVAHFGGMNRNNHEYASELFADWAEEGDVPRPIECAVLGTLDDAKEVIRRANVVRERLGRRPLVPLMRTQIVRPPGWRHPLDRLEDDLARVLYAFGLSDARRDAPEGSRRPHDERDADVTRWRSEVWASRGLVRRTLRALEELQGPRVAPPIDYRDRWTRIVASWNAAVRSHRWVDVPSLCEVCGRPTVGRRLDRRTRGQAASCAGACAATLKKRRQRSVHRSA